MLALKPCARVSSQHPLSRATSAQPVPFLFPLAVRVSTPRPLFSSVSVALLLVCSSEKKSRQAGTFGRCFRLSHIRTYSVQVFTIYYVVLCTYASYVILSTCKFAILLESSSNHPCSTRATNSSNGACSPSLSLSRTDPFLDGCLLGLNEPTVLVDLRLFDIY
jgi:hypothetical protein